MDGETPLGLNPFDLEGRSLDNNKIEVLSGIVQRFWRRMFGKDEEEQSVALTKFIQDYYATCLPPHSFPSFYRHVTEHYEDICRRKDVDPNYFDLSSFRLICSEFLPGERYANVCRTEGVPDFGNRRLVVFELTQIKQDKFILICHVLLLLKAADLVCIFILCILYFFDHYIITELIIYFDKYPISDFVSQKGFTDR